MHISWKVLSPPYKNCIIIIIYTYIPSSGLGRELLVLIKLWICACAFNRKWMMQHLVASVFNSHHIKWGQKFVFLFCSRNRSDQPPLLTIQGARDQRRRERPRYNFQKFESPLVEKVEKEIRRAEFSKKCSERFEQGRQCAVHFLQNRRQFIAEPETGRVPAKCEVKLVFTKVEE